MSKIDYKFLDSEYDEIQGLSSVVIKMNGELFEGKARLHPDDKEKASAYAGCRFAEKRAYIKGLKSLLKEEREKCDLYRNFVKSCENYKNWDRESPIAKDVYKQLNIRIKEVNKIVDKINLEIDALDREIRRQEIITNAIQTKKAKMIKLHS